MRGRKRFILWMAFGALALFAGLQTVPVERTNPPVTSPLVAPAEVEEILRRSCYDCHSHETRWPWYSYVAPISWRVADHVRHGRGDLNFSEWPAFDPQEQEWALRSIREQVQRNQMPLEDYLLLHPEAKLGDEDREVLLRWASSP